jgi:FtsP/CotA-like multicopper oxidase with cupredoxin domain
VTTSTRRQFAFGCSATIAAGFVCSRYAMGDSTPFTTSLPIPKLIDAATTGNAINLRLGTTEIWEIASVGMADPFHIHGASFRVLSINGQSPPAYVTGWKDVVLVEGDAELLVAFNRPATVEHPFMFHCHILEHEDAGLMAQYVCE